jgi:hypothetical protein|tara:strand:+ start:495 stop:782 length:288 start_codon:yes stop_codon:yes gene_type:complete
MSASSKTVEYHKTGFVVICDKDLAITPLTCDVCDYFMLKDTDEIAWQEYSCCHECAQTWADGANKKKWKDGWRPSSKVIKAEIKKRSRLVPRLKL